MNNNYLLVTHIYVKCSKQKKCRLSRLFFPCTVTPDDCEIRGAHHLFQDSMFLWLKIILTLAVCLRSSSHCTTNSGPIKSLLDGIRSWIKFCLYLLGLRRPLLITKSSNPSVENHTYKNLCHASLLPADTQSHRRPFSKGNSLQLETNAPDLEHLLPSFPLDPYFSVHSQFASLYSCIKPRKVFHQHLLLTSTL